MRSILAITMIMGLVASSAVASNVINEHSGYYQEDVHYSIVQSGGNDIGVRIHEGSVSSQVWKFEAYDSGTGDAGYINYIRIDPTGTVGPIRLSIVGAPGHTYGADDVKEINLTTNADDTTEIVEINISGDLATESDVKCNNITGNITVNGNMATGGDVDCDTLTGDITVGGTHGDGPGSTTYRLHADTGTGDISIAGDCLGNLELGTYHTGEITIGGLLLGDLDAGNPHDVTIEGVGTHEGNISFTGDDYYTHDLAIGDSGNQTSEMTGDIDINHGTHGHGGDTGWIRINADMHGSSRLFGLCLLRCLPDCGTLCDAYAYMGSCQDRALRSAALYE